MSELVYINFLLYLKGMLVVICVQFLLVFGDNVFFFVILVLMKQFYYLEWSQLVLQMLFVGVYIFFVFFVGQFVDSFVKGWVMMVVNGLKLFGVGCICFGVNLFIGYMLVGIGVVVYLLVKYGIFGEFIIGDKLVKVNGLMEFLIIVVILLGFMVGGIFVDWYVLVVLIVCVLVYGGVVVVNLWIFRLLVVCLGQLWCFKLMMYSFFSVCWMLWCNGEICFLLMGISLFWGVGVILCFLLVIWVLVVLGIISNVMFIYFNVMVVVGIVLGVGVVVKLVILEMVLCCMLVGILIGIVVIVFVVQQLLLLVFGLLLLFGVFGGFFIVLLNVLLQECGKYLVGVGNVIVVQNFGENVVMLLMLGFYFLVVSVGVLLVVVGIGFGVVFVVVIVVLWVWGWCK